MHHDAAYYFFRLIFIHDKFMKNENVMNAKNAQILCKFQQNTAQVGTHEKIALN